MFRGVYVASVTPFTSQGSLDVQALTKLLQWQASQGVQGFVPCGTTGENPTLSQEEWRTVVSTSIEVAKPKNLSVIAGCGSNNTSEAIDLIAEAHSLGAQGALIVTPYYNKPTPNGLVAHYQAIAERSKLPIVLYNVPGRTGVSLSVETLKELFQSDKIVGLKEATGNYSQWLQIAHDIDLKNKSLLAGDDDAFAPILALGGTGIISAAANVAPKQFVDLYELSQQNRWKEAFDLQKKLQPLVRALFLETNPAPTKFALSKMKRIQNTLRLPLVPIEAKTATVVTDSLSALGLI